MEHHAFAASNVPKAYGAYSHAVVAGDFVFVACSATIKVRDVLPHERMFPTLDVVASQECRATSWPGKLLVML